ncbi:MAG: T9SS type A sorting domain-containing protein [Ignavibacteriales bacterium]|nr:T9SS type A sorting domain-containing protein [Ignavibacteriales bacterium]
MKRIFTLLFIICLTSSIYAQTYFDTGLHATRAGKSTAYAKENGGMELITGIAMKDLACLKCHSTTEKLPDGSAINSATYAPSCNDCHNFAEGLGVTQQTCLNCHNRQVYEQQMYPDADANGDVHRKRGMKCMDCHKQDEMHGDGKTYKSWLDTGASKASCTDCHPINRLSSNTSHDTHVKNGNVDCLACHTTSIVSCTNCHFETLIATGKNRAMKKIKGFELLVKRNGKITSGTFMTFTYNGKTDVIIAPFRSHLIQKNARTCTDCHVDLGGNVAAIKEYNTDRKITMTKWNEAGKTVSTPTGVVPIPKDWKTSLKFDFATYDGDVNNAAVTDASKWRYITSNVNNIHMYYAEPLDNLTLAKLGFTQLPTDIKELKELPTEFYLLQNYPNPFNPTTNIKFSLPKSSHVKLSVYDGLGKVVATLVNEDKTAGTYEVDFNASKLSSGVYFYQIVTPNYSATKKLLLMK